jgi:hypothetical protein
MAKTSLFGAPPVPTVYSGENPVFSNIANVTWYGGNTGGIVPNSVPTVLFSGTIYWGEDSATACAQTIPITATGDGPTFCDSNDFTSEDFRTVGTGTIVIAYDGQLKTVNVSLGSNVATFNGGCDPCLATTTTTSTTTTTTTEYIPCLIKGTKVLLSSGVHKLIEDITYEDQLVVWNFDEGRFDFARPLWIKQPQTHIGYNIITFSDGSVLKTLQTELGHRIFNVEKGMFTYPMTDDTPIGTHTFNENGDLITLTSKEIVTDEIEYYNIITSKHMNLFTNSVLTSCRYNNIYPIVDMKFVKDDRTLRNREEFSNISDEYFEGLRLAEQTFALTEIEAYVEERETLDIKTVEFVGV